VVLDLGITGTPPARTRTHRKYGAGRAACIYSVKPALSPKAVVAAAFVSAMFMNIMEKMLSDVK
jgi:hypothetical protein